MKRMKELFEAAQLPGSGDFDGAERIERVVVAAVIRDAAGILLLKRSPDDYLGGWFELPGGVVEAGETLAQALQREVAEETGLEVVAIGRFLGSFDYPSGNGVPTRQLNFLVTARGTTVRLSEHETFAWVAPDRLGEYAISAEVRDLLNRALE